MESDHTQSEAKLLFKIFNFVSNVKIIQYTFNFPDLSFQIIFRASEKRGSQISSRQLRVRKGYILKGEFFFGFS